jgi:hypothetical protein
MKYCPILFTFGSKYSYLIIAENLAASYIKSKLGVEYPQHGQETVAKTMFFVSFEWLYHPASVSRKIKVAFLLCYVSGEGGGGELISTSARK